MKKEDQAYFEAITTLTAYPEWGIMVDELKKEIYQAQANVFQLDGWDKVCAARGWVGGLAYIVNMRDNNIKAMRTAQAEAMAAQLDADV